MKLIIAARILVVVLVPVLVGASLGGKNLLKNGDFEKFTGGEPDGWITSNIPKALTSVSPSTKAHSGKFAVKCEVKTFYSSLAAGMISQKNVPITGSMLQLSGQYVLNSVGKDAGYISIDLQNAEGSTVRICQENLVNPAAEFTAFKMAGSIPEGAVRLEIRFTLLPGTGSEKLHEGSYILLDDLELVAVSP